ncbi:galactokinase family protein [Demequina sp. SYSU T00068]|uniref:galactokinase n=1 Tax=Demequina lignilytica TaxID=3051663 RepID=UPI0026342A0C|nr:galactokinase family protein [Demequina sp. SYSU T00068]MDN4490120.1 galactokinase family protein [Demequina sp. SYSU T00068]
MRDAATSADEPVWLEPWSLDEGSDRVRALFADAFEGDPDAVASSPGRVTVIGDHTDYTEGLSLCVPIAHRTFVAVRRRHDQALRMVSGNPPPTEPRRWEGAVEALHPGSGIDWPDYVSGVIWAMVERGYPVSGLDIAIVGCVPLEAGLGSSASLTTAVARACDEAWGLALDSEAGAIELAELCWEAESAYVGFPCGRLDTHTVLRCSADEAVVLDFATAPPTLTHYPLYFHDYGLRLLVIDTGERRDDWMDAFKRRSRDAALAAEALGVRSLRELADAPDGVERVAGIEDPVVRRRARHVITEDRRAQEAAAALGGLGPAHDRFTEIGTLMLASHRSLRTDYEASTRQLDAAVDMAFAAGALGARTIGVGFGGGALALVRATDADRVADLVDAEFVRQGFAQPTFVLV